MVFKWHIELFLYRDEVKNGLLGQFTILQSTPDGDSITVVLRFVVHNTVHLTFTMGHTIVGN